MGRGTFRITHPMAFHKDGRLFRKLETRQISQVPQRPHLHPDEPMQLRNKKDHTMVFGGPCLPQVETASFHGPKTPVWALCLSRSNS